MKKASRKQLLVNLMLAFLVVVALISIFLWHSSSNNQSMKSTEKNIASMQDDIDFYKSEQKRYTAQSLTKQIKDDDIDVSAKKKVEKERIISGLQNVYNDVKSQDDYDKLKNDGEKNLGSELSDVLVELDKPTVNQSGKPAFAYDHMVESKVAFGKYNVDKHTMKCYVLVDWKSPTLDSTITGVKADETKTTLTGTDMFELDYHLDDDSLHVDDYSHHINEQGNDDKGADNDE